MGGQMGGRRDGKKDDGDSPRGSAVENLPSNAKDMGSIPGQGIKILHVTGQLSPCATTREPKHHD